MCSSDLKGKSMTTNVMLTLGHGVLHLSIMPPTRMFDPLPPRYEPSELEHPGEGLDIGHPSSAIQHLTTAQLKHILTDHHIKHSDEHGHTLNKKQLQIGRASCRERV